MKEKSRMGQLYSMLDLDVPTTYTYNPARKVALHRENFSAFLEGKDYDVQPVTVEVVPSLDCNFKCARCTYTQNKSKEKDRDKKRLMSQDVFDLVLQGLKDMYTKSIIFTGGGEPTKNPLYLDFMRQAKREGFEIGLYTNGALLSERNIENLLELEPFFVRVSLNAGTSQTHSTIYGYDRRSSIFDRVTKNVVELGRARKRLGVPTVIGVGYIISERNYFELDAISNLLLRLYEESDGGIDYATFRPEVFYFDEDSNVVTKQPNARIFAIISDQLEEKIGEVVRPSGMGIQIKREAFEHLADDYQDTPNIATPWCTSFDYDGRMYITSEHNGMEGFCIGDINTASIMEIWEGEVRKELMKKMKSGEIKTLAYFKLKTLNNLLHKIRDLGIFSQQEVIGFYKDISLNNSPSHVNFI